MRRVRLIDIPGYVLGWMRRRAGWPRKRLEDWFRKHRTYDGDPVSERSIERTEASAACSPLQTTRYRDAIGDEIFDQILEDIPTKFPHLIHRPPEEQHDGHESEESHEAEERPRSARARLRKAREHGEEEHGERESGTRESGEEKPESTGREKHRRRNAERAGDREAIPLQSQPHPRTTREEEQ
jgi:hypothetical protein